MKAQTTRRLRTVSAAALLALALAACAPLFTPLQQPATPAPPGETHMPQMVRMAVCWGALPLAQDLRAAYTGYRAGVSIEITPMASEQAQELLAAGQAELAIACAPAGVELAAAQGASPWQLLAHDGLAIVVNRERPLSQISRSDLERLYAGYVADWSLLNGGEGLPLLVVQGADATARQVFDAAILRERALSTAALVLPHDEAVLAYVGEHPLAIGYLSAAYLERDERVKIVALDRLLPTTSQLEQGGYPLGYSLWLAHTLQASEEAERLAAFCLGRPGREVIAQRYGLPR